MSAPASLQELLAREAIRECLHRYCRGIDRADEEALRSAYWPDATDNHGAYQGTASGFIEQALPKLRAGGRYFHAICNMGIELEGASAAVESYFLALQVAAVAPNRETFLAGRYLDRFERRDGEWRIADRTVVYDWMEERELAGPAQEEALFGARAPVGGRWPVDAVYGFLRNGGGSR